MGLMPHLSLNVLEPYKVDILGFKITPLIVDHGIYPF